MEKKQQDLNDDTPQEETLVSPGVIDKYQSAGKIANCKTKKCIISYFNIWLVVLQEVIKKLIPNANIVDICAYGDKLIETEVNIILSFMSL